jgi:trehalose-6-phosphate synthase
MPYIRIPRAFIADNPIPECLDRRIESIKQLAVARYRAEGFVILLAPLRDGMNLVAKEYVAAQDPDDPGVLILSRFTGAAIDFRRALLVNPYDAESVASALAQALVMPLEERRARHEALHAKVCEYDVNRWQREFLTALRGGREHERFHSYGSNGELTNLETSGARLAPIDQSAESRELERGDR